MKKVFKLALLLVFGLFCISAIEGGTSNFAMAEEGQKYYKTVRAEHILVDTEDEAWALKSRITEGESFEELAKQYSKCPSKEKGGDLGYFVRGQMVPEFEAAAFETPIGGVSDPVKTRYGWHLIKVTRKM